MEKIEWHNERRQLKDLIPASYNPRKLSEKAYNDLRKSLEKFNLADLPSINANNIVISGHQRMRVLADIYGADYEIDVRVPNRLLDNSEEKELNIRANKNLGEWDWEVMANEFDVEDLKDWGFEEKDLGFDIFPEDEIDDEVPDMPKEPQSQMGDLYELGGHRVLCGDSTSVDLMSQLMNGQKADLVLSDPPYNTGMQSKDDEKARLSHMFKDVFTEEEYKNLITDFLKNSFDNSKGECAFYIFIDWRRGGQIKSFMEDVVAVKNIIVWDKGVHGLGSDYKSTYELCIVGKKGKPKINNRYGLDYQDIWRVQRNIGRNKEHATAKPIELLIKPILHASKEDDICLDLFLGSGSTLIASEKTGRVCYGMEIDPAYVDVIVERYVKFTGNNKIKKNGQEIEWV